MEGRLVQLVFLVAFYTVSHCGVLYKLRSIGVGGQFLSIVLEFLSDRKQGVRLNGKVSASVDVASGVPQGSILELMFILYISQFFPIVGSYIVGYADNTTIYAVIPTPLSSSQVLESQNPDLAAINSWCLKWHMRLN